jgi:glycosyltransferase involved in cell wall biosynthesis
MNFFEKFFVKKADLVLTYSNFVKENLKKYLPNKNIEVLPLGIHGELCPGLEKQFNLNKESLEILFFGRIEEYKGIDTLIKAYEVLKKENLNIKLIIAGKGEVDENLKNKINDLEIIFKNYWLSNEELCELIKECDILIAPYKKATQSGIISTALAYGIPVIATKVGSFEEYIEDGKNGFLINVDDFQALAEKIKIFYENRSLILDMAQKAKGMGEQYKWSNIMKKAISYYEKNLNC